VRGKGIHVNQAPQWETKKLTLIKHSKKNRNRVQQTQLLRIGSVSARCYWMI